MSTATSNSGRSRKTLVKGILAGMVVTKLAYFVPVVHLFGPIFGGATTAFIINRGPWGGLKSGFLKGIGMTLPAFILGIYFAQMLAGIPIIGDLLAGSLGLIVLVIVAHSVTFGMVGGFVSGFIAQKVRSAPVKDTAKKGVKTANQSAQSVQQKAASNGGRNDETRVCRSCGVSYSEDVDFCRECGTESPFSRSDDSGDGTDSGPASASTGTSPGSDRNAGDATVDETDRCVACGAEIAGDVGFCPECGTESPFTAASASNSEPSSNAEVASPSDTGATRNSRSADPRDEGATDGRSERSAADSGAASADGPPVAVAAADAVSTRKRPRSDVAERLCRLLADPDADESRVESALGDAIDRLEDDAALADAVSDLDGSPTARQLESARSRVPRSGSDAADGLVPVFDRAIDLAEERDRSESERDRHRQAAERLCRAADGAVDLGPGDVADRATALADAIERGEVVVEAPSSSLSSLADRVRADARPQASETRRLLDALEEGDEAEAAERLRSTVERFDELTEVQAAIADIGVSDVRRRIESLERDLQRADGNVYRHLADRVRELEVMADEPDVDEVQLFAIYQECTFYDRTLVPRLARSDSSSESIDVARRARNIEDRIASVNDEYVSVRADHNHTIPKHFLELADTLCDRARRAGDEQPQQAAGQLAAASDLLDHVEELYERNEYSVMLRRLRG